MYSYSLFERIWQFLEEHYPLKTQGENLVSNRFVGFLKTVGKDFLKGLHFILPIAATSGEVAVSIFAPQLGALFNHTVAAVVTAEQNAAALGKQDGTGAQKAAQVLQIAGGLIKQGLEDAGRASDEAEVQKYIDSVVRILNAAPPPAGA